MAKKTRKSRKRVAAMKKYWRSKAGRKRRSKKAKIRKSRKKRSWGRQARSRVNRLYRLRRKATKKGTPGNAWGDLKNIIFPTWTKADLKTRNKMLARLRRYTKRGKRGAVSRKRLTANQKGLLAEARHWLREEAGEPITVAARKRKRKSSRKRRRRRSRR
jgi:hypothetical protein